MPKLNHALVDIDDLIEPVCFLASLTPLSDERDLKTLIEAAKRVQARYGFSVVTYKP